MVLLINRIVFQKTARCRYRRGLGDRCPPSVILSGVKDAGTRNKNYDNPLFALERGRVSELERYGIVGTPAEREFDDVAEVAAYLAGTPMAYISFLDQTHLWFKATYGFEGHTLQREQTYCHFVVTDERPVAIPDTRDETVYVPDSLDELGEKIRFYVGVPLRSKGGQILGTLCVVDGKPREVPEPLIPMLEKLAAQVSGQLELRRTNRMLLEERDTFSTLFEAAPAPLILAEEGKIVRCNYAFSGLVTDGDSDELIGLDLSGFLQEVPDRPGTTYETRMTNVVGVSTPVLVTLTRLYRDQRVYDLVALTDIADRKEKERILRDQRIAAENANRIKDTFLSLVSHDLRSPLSGISTMLELLDRGDATFTEDERREAIRDLREATAVLLEMINQLLNIHRLQSGRIEINREPVSVHLIARQVILSLGKQIKDKEVEVVLDVTDTFVVEADMGLFREALFNLVSNAIKFSPHHGVIRIREDANSVIVEDEGEGVPPEDVPNLFRHDVKTSRFGTDGERGTGLGLPLVSDIMRAHGGSVVLDLSYTAGARFVLDFGTAESTEE